MEEEKGYITDLFDTMAIIEDNPAAIKFFHNTCQKFKLCKDTITGEKPPSEEQYQRLLMAAQKTHKFHIKSLTA